MLNNNCDKDLASNSDYNNTGNSCKRIIKKTNSTTKKTPPVEVTLILLVILGEKLSVTVTVPSMEKPCI